jgi:hypothetical protein
VAEIGRDRLPEALFIVRDDGAQPRQPVEPLGQISGRLGPRPRDHGVEGVFEAPERGARQGSVQRSVQRSVQGSVEDLVPDLAHGAPPQNGVSPLVLLPQAGPLWNFWQGRGWRAEIRSIHLS